MQDLGKSFKILPLELTRHFTESEHCQKPTAFFEKKRDIGLSFKSRLIFERDN